MAAPAAETRIKTAQTRANNIWKTEVEHYQKEQNRFTEQAAKSIAGSPAQKQATQHATHAAACAQYCRDKIG